MGRTLHSTITMGGQFTAGLLCLVLGLLYLEGINSFHMGGTYKIPNRIPRSWLRGGGGMRAHGEAHLHGGMLGATFHGGMRAHGEANLGGGLLGGMRLRGGMRYHGAGMLRGGMRAHGEAHLRRGLLGGMKLKGRIPLSWRRGGHMNLKGRIPLSWRRGGHLKLKIPKFQRRVMDRGAGFMRYGNLKGRIPLSWRRGGHLKLKMPKLTRPMITKHRLIGGFGGLAPKYKIKWLQNKIRYYTAQVKRFHGGWGAMAVAHRTNLRILNKYKLQLRKLLIGMRRHIKLGRFVFRNGLLYRWVLRHHRLVLIRFRARFRGYKIIYRNGRKFKVFFRNGRYRLVRFRKTHGKLGRFVFKNGLLYRLVLRHHRLVLIRFRARFRGFIIVYGFGRRFKVFFRNGR